MQGQQEVTIDIGNVYDGVYQNTTNFGYNGNGVPITVNTRQEITIHRVQKLLLGSYTAPPESLGGWSLSEHHAYDPVGQKLYEGNGKQRNVQTVPNKIETFGGGMRGFFGDGGQVRDARFSDPYDVAFAPDGSAYIADSGNARIRKVTPDGIVTTFAGNGGGCNPSNFPCGDGGPATNATFGGVIRVAVAPDNSIYLGGGRNIWRITTDGIFHRVAGLALNGFIGDGGLATNAQINNPGDIVATSDGNLTLTRNAANGLLSGSLLGNVTDSYIYNGFAEPTNYNAKFGTTDLYDVNYIFDKLVRITRKTESVGGFTTVYNYGYDSTGRLTTVALNGAPQPLITYGFDSNDNRTSINVGGNITNANYDAQDHLTQYGATTYTYTLNGELQSKTNGGQTTQYNYDVSGNLRSVALPNATQIEYITDAQDRRIGKKINGTLTQGFLYQDQLEPVAELDGANNVVSRFVYGTRPNTPDYLIKGGTTYRIITDQIGSVRLVVDVATGDIAQRIDYDEFGVVLLDTNPGFQPFGFAGGIYDFQTGLTRFGSRDYDAETGRWTAKDPILFDGNDTNFYAYSRNNPINLVDPDGLSAIDTLIESFLKPEIAEQRRERELKEREENIKQEEERLKREEELDKKVKELDEREKKNKEEEEKRRNNFCSRAMQEEVRFQGSRK